MNDIFLSYAGGDRAVAQELADGLEALGWSVWWDREIPFGKSFDQVIEEELNAARCVIVLWTAESIGSRWVKTEAAAAADRNLLIPVLLERVAIPFEFRRIQTAELYDWSGDRTHPDFVRLVESVKRMIGQPTAPQPQPAPSRRSTFGAVPARWKAIGAAAIALLLISVGIWMRDETPPTPAATASREPPEPAAPKPQAAENTGGDASRSAQKAPSRTSTPAGEPPPGQPSANQRPQSAASKSHAKGSVMGPFAIRIGDRIEDGVPAPGAGFIDAPGEKDVYTFTATARQRVYFRMLKHGSNMSLIGWKLTDPDGRSVFDVRLGHTEPGVQVLRTAGTYQLTVGADDAPATGGYVLQLFDVPAPQQFKVKLGDAISENVPAEGAGRIESPGARDVYLFDAKPGQRAYFRKFEIDRGMELIAWRLTDADGAEVFDTRLGHSEPGMHILRRGGAYRLEVGADQVPATGVYRIQVLDVAPPEKFDVKIGDTIGEHTPKSGAGIIERPGAMDVYTFTAEPGQRVYFRKLEYTRGMELIDWRLIDADGTAVFSVKLGHSEPGAHALRRGGTYTMEVGSATNAATGSYRIQLSGTPPG
jgi:TIR domain